MEEPNASESILLFCTHEGLGIVSVNNIVRGGLNKDNNKYLHGISVVVLKPSSLKPKYCHAKIKVLCTIAGGETKGETTVITISEECTGPDVQFRESPFI